MKLDEEKKRRSEEVTHKEREKILDIGKIQWE